MKKYNPYIIEKASHDEIDIILEECSECVSLIKSTNKFFWRGLGDEERLITQYTTKGWERTPKDVPPVIHKIMNELFVKKFGWKARDGVFVYRDSRDTFAYGESYMVFPTNGFKYVWSPDIRDLWAELSYDMECSEYLLDFLKEDDQSAKARDQYYADMQGGFVFVGDPFQESPESSGNQEVTIEQWREMVTDEWLYNYMEKSFASKYKDSGIEDSNIIGGREIMIKCDKYYVINVELEEYIVKKLNIQ